MIGGEGVPYGKLWRTGANEPTVIFTPVALDIAGVKVAPGKYSIYTVPGEKEWEVIVNTPPPSGATRAVHHGGEGAGSRPGQGQPPRRLARRSRPSPSRADPASGETQGLVLDLGEDPSGHPGQGGELSHRGRRRATRATPSSSRSTSSAVV